MNVVPSSIDMSVLEFLQHGDRELIAAMDRQAGHKTDRRYVSRIIKGECRNDRILQMAFELALKRKSKFPKQVIKHQLHAA
jgi:hypothetical protein